MENVFTPERIEQLETEFRKAILRFASLDEKPNGFTSRERVEYDTLGGALVRIRDLIILHTA